MNGRIRVAALLIDLEGALRSRLLWDARTAHGAKAP